MIRFVKGDSPGARSWIALQAFFNHQWCRAATPALPSGRATCSDNSEKYSVVKVRMETEPACGQFQSTPPRGRRPHDVIQVTGTIKFQSTPPRGRRPGSCQRDDRTARVSIHASEGEATCQPRTGSSDQAVSIHASEGEATLIVTIARINQEVSIHASEGEAT